MRKTALHLQQDQDHLEQRLLAIPEVVLVTKFDPADLLTSTALGASPVPSPGQEEGAGTPPRRWLFEKAWLGFSSGHDEMDAQRVFEKHFGRKPEFVYLELKSRTLWVGPV